MEVKTTLLRIVYKALCDSADGNPVRWALMCYTAAQQVLTVFVRPSVRPLACTSTLKHKLTPFRTLSLTLALALALALALTLTLILTNTHP